MLLKGLNSLILSGKEVYPIIEGGKGISVSNGVSAGYFALSGAIGTFSGVNAQRMNDNGEYIPLIFKKKTRGERHEELMRYSVHGAIDQAKRAYDISGGKGRIHMNLLWEAAGTERILHEVFEKAKGLIHGVTCGAGMPYRIAPLAEKYQFFYYPIVSSMRAFRALWKRSYHKFAKYLGAVVYEDPWKAGGHNGLSNAEDPKKPENPYPRVKEIRSFMNEVGLNDVPIVMAGGVWHIEDYKDWLDNEEIGNIAFQFGTRPIITKENPAPDSWKKKLLTLQPGDVFLNRYSPTGFYSSAVNNDFIKELRERSARQINYSANIVPEFSQEIKIGSRGRSIYIKEEDYDNYQRWLSEGFIELLKTPDNSIIFVTPSKSKEIRKDQVDCMGCLSACKFSNWSTHTENMSTGKKPDPRSYCIQKTLQEIILDGDVNNQLMFAGHNAFQFAKDPYYNNGFIPSTKELIARILTGK